MNSKKEILEQTKSIKIKALIDDKNNGDLPQYPSAQLWFKKMSETERAELKKTVEAYGMDWSEYEKNMFAHFPKEVKASIEYKKTEGRH